MLRARRISPRDSRRSGMPLNVDGWCEVVLQLTDGVRSAIGEEREHWGGSRDRATGRSLDQFLTRYEEPGSTRPGTRCLLIRRQLNSTLDFLFPCIQGRPLSTRNSILVATTVATENRAQN